MGVGVEGTAITPLLPDRLVPLDESCMAYIHIPALTQRQAGSGKV